jgi:hypothetical protein
MTNTQDSPSSWVQWATLRPTQGAVGYVQVEAKKSSYRELDPEKDGRSPNSRPSR